MNDINVIQPEWDKLRLLNRIIKNTRSRLVTSIMKKVKPLMWASGYVKHEDKEGKYVMLKLISFNKEGGYKLRNSNIIIAGFTEENCIIDDAIGGGMSTLSLYTIPIEDLIKVWAWVENDRYNLLTNKIK